MEAISCRRKHFLVVTYPAQGQINPAIHLANRLVRTIPGARVTFSTAVSAHRKMFPHLASPDQEFSEGAISYAPFSDGHDDGTDYLTRLQTAGKRSLSSIIRRLDSRGEPVGCMIYTFFMPWAADVARAEGIVSVQYWIQPATVVAIYYHSFRQYGAELIAAKCKDPASVVELPGLPPLRIRELPSLVLSTDPDDPYYSIAAVVKEAFDILDCGSGKKKPKVLVNTFHELEPDAFSAVADSVELVAIGSVMDRAGLISLVEPDKKAYMEWLDSKAERSVVYVSFGTVAVVKKKQMEEIAKGLKASGRPFLWVVRRDCRYEGDGLDGDEWDGDGMIVEWCLQMRVLSHAAVGCFVTHCGWNSTVESLVCGVPTVGVPQWTDQGTNAMLMEKAWGTGVRGEVGEDGVVGGEELRRCLELVMGGGERGREIRKNVELCKERAVRAVEEGGSSDRNLRAFVEEIIKSD